MPVDAQLRTLKVDIPSQPDALVELSLMLADDQVNLHAMSALIAADMALASAVLKAVTWRGLLAGTGLVIEHQEIMEKTMPFRPWVEQQAVTADRVRELEHILRTASLCLAAFLKPEPLADGADQRGEGGSSSRRGHSIRAHGR